MEETKEEQTKKKWSSRKFIVWVTATVLYFGILAYSFIAESSVLAEEFTQYWAYISIFYLGGNVAQDFAFKGK